MGEKWNLKHVRDTFGNHQNFEWASRFPTDFGVYFYISQVTQSVSVTWRGKQEINLVAGEIAYIGKAATVRGRITSHAKAEATQLVEKVIQADPVYKGAEPDETKQFFKIQFMKLQDFKDYMTKLCPQGDDRSPKIFKSYNQGDLESFMIHQHRKRYGAMPVLNRRRDYIYYTNSPEREAKGKKNFTRHGTVRRAVVTGKRGIHKKLPRRLDFSCAPFSMHGGPQAAVLDEMDLDAHESKLCGKKRSRVEPQLGTNKRQRPNVVKSGQLTLDPIMAKLAGAAPNYSTPPRQARPQYRSILNPVDPIYVKLGITGMGRRLLTMVAA